MPGFTPTPQFPNAQSYARMLLDHGEFLIGLVGTKIFLAGGSGNDNNDGLTPDTPVKTLEVAYSKLRDGKNDCIVIMADGTTTETVRLNSSFTWSKNAAHMIGLCSPVLFSQRARIAPTGATTAFKPFITISGNGCVFKNVQLWHGFNTGTTASINCIVSGSRNYFKNVHFAGLADAASAGSTTSRSLKLMTGGENLFEDCVVGIDTIDRGVANASLEFASGAVRNVFRRCIFPFRATAAGVLGIITSAAAAMDRYNIFEDCEFLNHNTTMTAIATLAASSGGFLLFKNPTLAKITGFGSDAGTRGQIYIDGGAPAAATTGLAVAPTA